MTPLPPLVSIVTPVYNGEQWVAECIESVLAQTYANWEYIIVENCSTDNTLQIAKKYAGYDARVRVHKNRTFVGVIDNHNNAFRLISPKSKYCKVVSADDWLYPQCIAELVDIAETHSSVGIVGSYAVRKDNVLGLGVPLRQSVFSGHEIGRLRLLGADVIGSPSSLIYRACLIRATDPFFPCSSPHGDLDACFRVLEHADYGFVHQILSFERVHDASVSAGLMEMSSFLVDHIEFLAKYGRLYLTSDELITRAQELRSLYYDCLAVGVVNLRKEVWHYHRNRMKAIGINIEAGPLTMATIRKLADLVLNPKSSFEKVIRRVKA